MALDRWIALAFVGLCCAYGYAAFFTMDHLLPPILQRNPIWPSTFPKILSVLGLIVGLIVLFTTLAREDRGQADGAIDLSRLGDYHVGQAIALLALMVAYALTLRAARLPRLDLPVSHAGQLRSWASASWISMILVAGIATSFGIWYLVQEVLGIFLRPCRSFCDEGTRTMLEGLLIGLATAFSLIQPRHGRRRLPDRHVDRHVARALGRCRSSPS